MAESFILVLNVVSVTILALSALLVYLQIRKAHEWNRRKAAHDLIFEASLGRFRKIRDHLEQKIDIYDEAQTYDTLSSELDKQDHIFLDAALNFFDNLCLAIKNNVVDESIVYDSISNILVAYARWASPWIKQNRAICPLMWIEMDPYVEKWKQRDKETATRMIRPGASKL